MADGLKDASNYATFKFVLQRLAPYGWKYRWRLLAMLIFTAVSSAGQKALVLFLDPVLQLIFPGQSKPGIVDEAAKSGWMGEKIDAFRHWFLSQVFGTADGRPGTEAIDSLWRIFFIILGITIFAAISQYVTVMIARNVGLRMIIDLRRDLCQHLLRLSMRYHGEKKMGDLLTRLTTDVSAALRAVTILFEDVAQLPFMILFTLVGAFYGNYLLTFVVLILIPLVALPIAFFARKVRKGSFRSTTAYGATTTTLEQMLSGIRVVKAFQMEDREMEGLQQAEKSFLRKTMQMVRAKAATESFLVLFTLAGTALMLVLVGIVQHRWNTFGTMERASVYLASIMTVYAHVKQLTRFWSSVLESSGSGARLIEILDLEPEVADRPQAAAIAAVREGLEFRNVDFAYETEPVLQAVSFQAKAGSRIAIVGPSGAGKTTTLDLIARFYDPKGGAILVDGKDLREIKIDSWLEQIAIVSQQPFLFNTTIRENIRYGRPEASDTEIDAAAKAAHVAEFVAQLPQGYDTMVGERGAKLSGGQLQRITIARAILKNASVLLLDEATSSLDSESERAVQSALDNLMRGKTTFVIAHRLSTVRGADQILVLERGKLVEKGSHGELLAKGGTYKRLHDIQFAAR